MSSKAQVPPRRSGFRPKDYAHIVLSTAQPDALIDWYCAVLGMQVVMRHPMISFLTWDDSHDRLAIVPMRGQPDPRPSNAPGLHHVAFEVGSLQELADQYLALSAQGIQPVRCINHGVATSMYYADPDGNSVELTVSAFPSVTELNAWLATGAFDENPIGVFYEPHELLERLASGEAEAQILQPDARHAARLPETLVLMRG